MKAFITYSWDSEEHSEWVRRFADELIKNGIDTTLDQYDLNFGKDRFEFMEKAVDQADLVLAICTPTYVEKANQREKGVGVETSIITPRFFDDHPGKELIPIIRVKGTNIPHTPFYMSALYFVDFRNDSKYDEKMEDLLRHLHGKPRYIKPPLGPAPEFGPGNSSRIGTTDVTSSNDLHVFVSHPFSSVNREVISDTSVSVADKLRLRLSFSHMPTEAPASRSRIVDIIDSAHGLIAVWDDSRQAHALLRPWRTFEFESAKTNGIPTILFSHERFRELVGRQSEHIVYFTNENLRLRLQECFEKIKRLIERTKR